MYAELSVFANSLRHRFSGAFWPPFCHPSRSLLAPFGVPWAPLGSLWVLGGSILAALAIIFVYCGTQSHLDTALLGTRPRRHPFYSHCQRFSHSFLSKYKFLCTRTCKATADYHMHPYLRMAPNFLRPGAGILPSATEIITLSTLFTGKHQHLGPTFLILGASR